MLWLLGEHSLEEQVRIHVCTGAPGFEKAPPEPSLLRRDKLLLTLRTTYL